MVGSINCGTEDGMKITLPEKFEKRMREQLGAEFESYRLCLDEHCRSGLRVNTQKLSAAEFAALSPFALEPVPWIENGFFYPDGLQPAKHPYYFAGLYYLQEPSAMTPASLLPVEPGDRVLDICAAPGGKSTELAARLHGEGVLVSNDISNSRAKALLKNLELFGVKNAVVVSESPAKLAGRFESYFDKILVDAPCSGEGMFRKSPAIMKNWEQYGTGYYSELQRQILPDAIRMLRPGGYLLYSTCTFSPEENEGAVQYMLDNFPELELVPALPVRSETKESSPPGPDYTGMEHGRPDWTDHGSPLLDRTLRLWPHKIRGEGHFIALLRKEHAPGAPFGTAVSDGGYPTPGAGCEPGTAEAARSHVLPKNVFRGKKETAGTARAKTVQLPEEAKEFLAKLRFSIPEERLCMREDRLYLLPEELPDLSGLRILRSGLLIGEMKKNRFEPSQALACALKKSEYDSCLSLAPDDPDIIRYLKCEAIEPKQSVPDGFVLVCAGEYPLGWGKKNRSGFKNRYLPGWRMM